MASKKPIMQVIKPLYAQYQFRTVSNLRRAQQLRIPRWKPDRTPIQASHDLQAIRYASTTSIEPAAGIYPARTRNLVVGTAIGLVLVFSYLYVTDTRAGVHQWLVIPTLRRVYPDAEEAHEAGNHVLKTLYQFGLHPRERDDPDKAGDLKLQVFQHILNNPIGTSAGIDKHAQIPDPLLALGPSIIEIGGATPYPQDGNPKPRVFRLPSQKALINRYGLNSEGADHMAMRLRERLREFCYANGFGIDEEAEQRVLDGEAGVPPGSLTEGKLMAVQVAKNKFTPDDDLEAVKQDYVYCVETLARYADVLVVNVSSPNTPGLRGLQQVDKLTNILTGVVSAARKAHRKVPPPVMVKVSPDEDSDEQVSGICDAVKASGCAGVIVGNTTKRRPDPLPLGSSLPEHEAALMLEQGGYSGPQLFERTVALVKRYRRILDENEEPRPSSSSESDLTPTVVSHIQATAERDSANLKPPSETSDSQPLLRLPERSSPSISSLSHPATPRDRPPALSSSSHINQLPSALASPSSHSTPTTLASSSRNSDGTDKKVIFATGGITNGKQALEVLEAGASVAMVYTALVYGGVGTISRIKREMREEIAARQGAGGRG